MLSISELSEQYEITNPSKSFCHFTIQASAILPKFDEEVKILLDREYGIIQNLILINSDATIKNNELDDIIKEIYNMSYLKIFKSAFLHL